MNDPRFGSRMTGEGVYADAIGALFKQTADKLGLTTSRSQDEVHASTFERPFMREGLELAGDQLTLFR